MEIVDATWERRNLGVDAAEIVLSGEDDALELAKLQDELDARYDYLCLKSEVGCSEALFGLPRLGYTFVETQISLRYDLREDTVAPFVVELCKAQGDRYAYRDITDDEARYAEMISRISDQPMFTTDRVYLDQAFAGTCAGRRYAGWCWDLKEKGARFLETEVDGRVTGFTVYLERSLRRFESPLGGNYLDAKDFALLSPVGSRMFFSYLAEQGMKTLDTWVSSNNKTILRFHLAAGYQVRNLHYVYVKHTNRIKGGNDS